MASVEGEIYWTSRQLCKQDSASFRQSVSLSNVLIDASHHENCSELCVLCKAF